MTYTYVYIYIYMYRSYLNLAIFMHTSYLLRISTDLFGWGADRLAEQVEDLKSKAKIQGETAEKRCEPISGTFFFELFFGTIFWNQFFGCLVFFPWEYRESCEGWKIPMGWADCGWFFAIDDIESCCRTSFFFFLIFRRTQFHDYNNLEFCQ